MIYRYWRVNMKKILLLSLFTCSAWPMEPASLLETHTFPVMPLTVKYASMSPDTSTIVGIAKDADGANKVRFVTISKDRENPEHPLFSDVPFANQGDNISIFAWNPVRQLLAFASKDRNVALVHRHKNNLNSIQAARTSTETKEAIHTLVWNPKGDKILAASTEMVFVIPVLPFDLLELCQNYQTKQIPTAKGSSCNAALWSPSGDRILLNTSDGSIGTVTIIDWRTHCVESVFTSKTPIYALDWDNEDEKSLLFVTRHGLNTVQYDKAVSSQKHEYHDSANDIEQILALNDRMVLFKTREHDACTLNILDRLQRKAFPLYNVVCQGTLKLSGDKKFAYGSQEGDSIVDLSTLANNLML